jgi:hypothetical protein
MVVIRIHLPLCYNNTMYNNKPHSNIPISAKEELLLKKYKNNGIMEIRKTSFFFAAI